MNIKRYSSKTPRPLLRTRRRVIVIEEAALSESMKSLSLLCRRHVLPLPMLFVEEATLADGTPVAVYGCSYAACTQHMVWAEHPVSGQPVKIWEGGLPGRR